MRFVLAAIGLAMAAVAAGIVTILVAPVLAIVVFLICVAAGVAAVWDGMWRPT